MGQEIKRLRLHKPHSLNINSFLFYNFLCITLTFVLGVSLSLVLLSQLHSVSVSLPSLTPLCGVFDVVVVVVSVLGTQNESQCYTNKLYSQFREMAVTYIMEGLGMMRMRNFSDSLVSSLLLRKDTKTTTSFIKEIT